MWGIFYICVTTWWSGKKKTTQAIRWTSLVNKMCCERCCLLDNLCLKLIWVANHISHQELDLAYSSNMTEHVLSVHFEMWFTRRRGPLTGAFSAIQNQCLTMNYTSANCCIAHIHTIPSSPHLLTIMLSKVWECTWHFKSNLTPRESVRCLTSCF